MSSWPDRLRRRVGIMGGTFDPIHIGHLVCADEARHAFELDEVVFIPAGHPWQKDASNVSEASHRLEMTRRATHANNSFSTSSIEIQRQGPTYTVDTLREMSAPDRELFFISGADAVAQILTWKDPADALHLATFIAATRPGHDFRDRLDPEICAHVNALEIPALDISSTDIRDRVRHGRAYRYLVTESVGDYIADARLYRTSQ